MHEEEKLFGHFQQNSQLCIPPSIPCKHWMECFVKGL